MTTATDVTCATADVLAHKDSYRSQRHHGLPVTSRIAIMESERASRDARTRRGGSLLERPSVWSLDADQASIPAEVGVGW